jgi:uncharacterized protein DUF3179
MKPHVVLPIVLSVALGACGGVREAIRTAPAGAGVQNFDARELVDVLPFDRIPAITAPRFESAAKAGDWLSGAEPVIALSVGVEARAYPLAIMLWHEIVDDVIGGVPVAVTYAPLANAAIVYDRRVAQSPGTSAKAVTFRVSGKLYRSDLVMYDRRAERGGESLWTQLDGRAEAGPRSTAVLSQIPSQIVSLDTFRAGYPTGVVLARPDSGRAYGFNPYAGYESRTQPFGGFTAVALDPRRRPMERVVGVRDGATARAIAYDRLRSERTVAGDIGGAPFVVLWAPGARSALDTAQLVRGRDVGQTGVFRPLIDGRTLDLAASPGGGFRDRQTGSTWNVLGIATAGPLRGRSLEPVAHVDTFWFAWSAFFRGTNA